MRAGYADRNGNVRQFRTSVAGLLSVALAYHLIHRILLYAQLSAANGSLAQKAMHVLKDNVRRFSPAFPDKPPSLAAPVNDN
jgi:hypothetical protein